MSYKIKVSAKKRLENNRYGLKFQYGQRARDLAQSKFNKDFYDLNQQEIDILAEELHKTKFHK